MKPKQKSFLQNLDWVTTILPFGCITLLCCLFMIFPEGSANILASIRFFLGDQLGSYYLLMGLGAVICSLYMAFSRFGSIKLGDVEKPQYTAFQWGSMMFTAGLAADILFYSLCEWMLYADESHISEMGSIQDWTSVYPLFHWGPIPWSFYIILAVAFGFMIHVRRRNKQKYSEACRPLLGKKVDGVVGKLIDLTAVFALLAGTATTFSLATPLLSMALSKVLGVAETPLLTIAILVIICIVYTLAVYFGMQGVTRLAASCIYLFFVLLAYFLFLGGQTRYIIETGITAIGLLTQNFISLATWTDALRTSSFPQNWTILGGYFFGLAGTFTSFIILGNYGLGLQTHGILDLMGLYRETGDLYQAIIAVFETMPAARFGLILLAVTMIAFYATTFDALTMVASSYSYRSLDADEEPDKKVKLFWAITLMLFPIALIFSENSMSSLQSVSIVAAFPIGFIILMIVWSFFKDADAYLHDTGSKG